MRSGPNIGTNQGVQVDIVPGTATAADFSGGLLPALAAYSGSMTSVDFSVSIEGDDLNEAAETFSLSFSVFAGSESNDVSLPAPLTVTINDDDAISVTIANGGTDADGTAGGFQAEEGTSATFTVTLSAASSSAVQVPFDIAGLEFTDYDGLPTSSPLTIAAGETSGNILIPLAADMDTPAGDENSEEVTVQLRTAGYAAAGMIARGGTFRAMQAIVPTSRAHVFAFSNPDISISEGDTVTYAVSRAGRDIVDTGGIVLNWAYAAIGANPPDADDFGGMAPAGGQLTFTGDETEERFVIAIAQDAESEPSETFRLSLSAASAMSVLASEGGVVLPRPVEVTIAASDQPLPTLDFSASVAGGPACTDCRANEGDTVVITLTLSAWTGSNLATRAVQFGGSATPGTDFTGPFAGPGNNQWGVIASSPRFTETDLSVSRTYTISNDITPEPDETITLAAPEVSTHFGPGGRGGILPGDSLIITIAANDRPTFSVAADDTATTEGDTATFTVTLGEGVPSGGAAAMVDWSIEGAGIEDSDYVLGVGDTDGTLDFTATGDQTVTLAIAADNLNEAAETLSFTLSNPRPSAPGDPNSAIIATATAVTTIAASDDIAVSIADAAAAVSEGEEAAFVITLAGATAGSAAAINVPYTVASSGTYDVSSITPGMATIPVGTTASHTLRLTMPNDDNLDSGSETVTVTLTAAASGPPVVVGPTAATGGGNVAVSVTSGDETGEVTVNFRAAAHTFTLSNNPAATIAEDDSDVTETYTMTRAGPTITGASGLTVTWAVTAAGAAATDASGADFAGNALPTGTVTFTGTETSETFDVVIAGDNLNEDSEEFTIEFSVAAAHMAAATANGGVAEPPDHDVAITDDDDIEAAVTATTAVRENGNAEVNVDLGAIPTRDITVGYTIGSTSVGTDVDADADDYTHTGSTGSIPITEAAGLATGAISIPLVADNLNEAAETFTVAITAADITGAHGTASVASGGTQTFTIAESDPVTYSIARVGSGPVNEGASVDFTVTLSGASAGSAAQIQVPYTVRSNGAYDVSSLDGMVAFPANSVAAQTISLTLPSSDALGSADPAQTLTVELDATADIGPGGGSAARSGSAGSASVMVRFQDAAHSFTLASPAARIAETDANVDTTYTLTRSGPNVMSGQDIVVTWTVTHGGTTPTGGTAAAADFAANADGDTTTGTVTFSGTDTSDTFDIRTVGDTLNEADETFTLAFSIASANAAAVNTNGGASLPSDLAVTIADDDPITATLSGSATVNEGASGSVTVTLSGGTATAPVTLSYADANNEATGTVTIPVGTTSGMLTLTATDDEIGESDETIALNPADFTATSAGAGEVTVAGTATLIINANDDITVTIAADEPRAFTGRAANFTVSMSNPSMAAVTLSYTVALSVDGEPATIPPANIVPASPLTFTAGQLDDSVAVTIPAEVTVAESGALTFTLTGATAATGGGTAMLGDPSSVSVPVSSSDDPETRTQRMEQAATALNRAAAALTVPVIARRLDPARGLASPGLALNLGGQQLLSPASGGGSVPSGAPATPAASGAAPTLGLGAPRSATPAATPANGAPLSAPSTKSTASTQSATAPNLAALAQLAATQLEGLDSTAPATEPRTLAQLLGSSGFSATGEGSGGNTLSVWGRGNYTSLEGEPLEGGTSYDYDGDSYGFYLGLDGRYDQYLLGVAVGYTVGDIELRAVSGGRPGTPDRSDYESDLVAVYPYAAWQPSERLSVWLMAGYGQGELEIEEHGAIRRKATSDTDLWLGAAGLSLRQPAASGVELLLRLSATALHGETDGGTFDDPARTAYAKMETDAQQLRGEAELGRAFGFDDGASARPYLRAGASYDFGDGARDAVTGEFGAGVRLHWPRLGLETEWEGEARLASKGDRDYREYSGTGTLRYDLGGDRRGLQLSLRPSLGLARGAAGGLGAAGVPLDGGAFGGAGTPALGGAGTGGSAGHDVGLGLRSELAYGIGDVRLARGLPGLLTLYGKSELSSGASGYGGGLRFEAARFALDAGLRHDSGADSDSQLLLDATLRF